MSGNFIFILNLKFEILVEVFIRSLCTTFPLALKRGLGLELLTKSAKLFQFLNGHKTGPL